VDDQEVEADIVRQINEIVKSGRGEKNLSELLSNPVMGLSDHILPFATPLYLSELNYISRNLKTDLKKATIVKTCKFLFDVAKINGAVESHDVSAFWSYASDPRSKLVSLVYFFAYINRKNRLQIKANFIKFNLSLV
jgi:hypothetical protein